MEGLVPYDDERDGVLTREALLLPLVEFPGSGAKEGEAHGPGLMSDAPEEGEIPESGQIHDRKL